MAQSHPSLPRAVTGGYRWELTGVCPRSRGGYQTTWPHTASAATVSSGWPNGGTIAGKNVSALGPSFPQPGVTKCPFARSVPSSSQDKVLGLSTTCQALSVPCRVPFYIVLVSIFPRPSIPLLDSSESLSAPAVCLCCRPQYKKHIYNPQSGWCFALTWTLCAF